MSQFLLDTLKNKIEPFFKKDNINIEEAVKLNWDIYKMFEDKWEGILRECLLLIKTKTVGKKGF